VLSHVLLRADNNGEGGTLALMALARRVSTHGATILYFGIIGASLFFGDALITPAISVLSAIDFPPESSNLMYRMY